VVPGQKVTTTTDQMTEKAIWLLRVRYNVGKESINRMETAALYLLVHDTG
jgi:hypothetical protein